MRIVSPYWSLAFTWAPLSSRVLTSSKSPLAAAMMRCSSGLLGGSSALVIPIHGSRIENRSHNQKSCEEPNLSRLVHVDLPPVISSPECATSDSKCFNYVEDPITIHPCPQRCQEFWFNLDISRSDRVRSQTQPEPHTRTFLFLNTSLPGWRESRRIVLRCLIIDFSVAPSRRLLTRSQRDNALVQASRHRFTR